MKVFIILTLIISFYSVTAAEKEKTEKKKTGLEKTTFDFYGFVELYGIQSNKNMVFNDLLLYPDATRYEEDHSGLFVSAKKSRFGIKMSYPDFKCLNLKAQLEFDFFGNNSDSGAGISRSMLRTRLALMNISKVSGANTFGLIAGQDWAIASPMVFPSLINPVAGWTTGNIWQRMPQIQFYYNRKLGKDLGVDFKLAAAAPMSGSSLYRDRYVVNDFDAGNASNLPNLQAQLGFKGKFSGIDLYIALAGSFGKEDYTNSTTGLKGEADVYLFAAALKVVQKYGGLSGKFYMGKNIDVFGAGMGAALETKTDDNGTPDDTTDDFVNVEDGIEVMGFFGELQITPFGPKSTKLAVGYGMDDPNEDQGAVKYEKNTALWVSLFQTMWSRFTFGLSFMKFNTTMGEKDYDSNHFLFQFKFVF